jgi:hypothetical protein
MGRSYSVVRLVFRIDISRQSGLRLCMNLGFDVKFPGDLGRGRR